MQKAEACDDDEMKIMMQVSRHAMFEFLDALSVTTLSPSNMQRHQCNPNSWRSNLNTVFCAAFASILPIPPLGRPFKFIFASLSFIAKSRLINKLIQIEK